MQAGLIKYIKVIGTVLAVATVTAPARVTLCQTLIGFQGFETNSVAVAPVEPLNVVPTRPGVLTFGQQDLELLDTGVNSDNGSRIFEFIQPNETFNFESPAEPLPPIDTGRVFNATDGSLPWRLFWSNSRVDPGSLDAIVDSVERADELEIFLNTNVFVDLMYAAIVTDIILTGPVIPDDDLVGADVAINLKTGAPVELGGGLLGGQIGTDADQSDAFGVATVDRLDREFEVFDPVIDPEGSQFFFVADPDGSVVLELDSVSAEGFGGLELNFDLAIGDTGYEVGDRFAVIVNGETVLNLEEFIDPVAEVTVSPLQDAENAFATQTLDLSQFAGLESVQISFLMDSTADTEAFALDNIQLLGLEDPPLRGDYNDDGAVNAADYTVWRDSLNQAVAVGSGADGDGNGLVNGDDFTVWKDAYTGALPPPAILTVPSPAGLCSCGYTAAAMMLFLRRRGRCAATP